MKTKADLAQLLSSLDGSGYGAYRRLQGEWDMGDFTLFIDRVQPDPFAAPSLVRLIRPHHGLPPDWIASRARRVAAEDYIARQVAKRLRHAGRGRGSGNSGRIVIDEPGQQMLERTCVNLDADSVEARLAIDLPANGRRVLGRQAATLFLTELPRLVDHTLRGSSLDRDEMMRQIELYEDQEYLRQSLAGAGLVAFVANGSILPRRSGVSDLPLEEAVPFVSPPSLEVQLTVPHRGSVRGMGIPVGITVIVGGGYHGKSTLLRAMERGIFNHIEGDGRQLVIARSDVVKIRAEEGRRVEKVDISPFIGSLPNQPDTTCFCTENASGSTSQAANIMEALELGCGVLLIDEDTSAANFMTRDARMQTLVEREPIRPLLDRVRSLFQDRGVSCVVVTSGSGDYLDVADTVILMDRYRPLDVTARAREVARRYPNPRRWEAEPFPRPSARVPLPDGLRPFGKHRVKIRGVDEIRFGMENIDIRGLDQLVDPSQTRAIAGILYYAGSHLVDGKMTIAEILQRVMQEVREQGLDRISPPHMPRPRDYALPRIFEVGGALNRLRSLRIKSITPESMTPG